MGLGRPRVFFTEENRGCLVAVDEDGRREEGSELQSTPNAEAPWHEEHEGAQKGCAVGWGLPTRVEGEWTCWTRTTTGSTEGTGRYVGQA
jgi:hypothetical protein